MKDNVLLIFGLIAFWGGVILLFNNDGHHNSGVWLDFVYMLVGLSAMGYVGRDIEDTK